MENSHISDGAAVRDGFGFHDVAGVLAGDVLLQPDHDADRFGGMRADGGLDCRHAAGLPPQNVRRSKRRNQSAGRFSCRRFTAFVPSSRLALDARQRHLWDVLTARVAKLRFAEGMMGNLIQAGVRPLERFAVSGSYAVGVYLALSTNDPVYIGALFAFLMLSQRVSGPLLQMAKLINQYDEARIAVAVVGQPRQSAGGRRPFRPRRAHAH